MLFFLSYISGTVTGENQFIDHTGNPKPWSPYGLFYYTWMTDFRNTLIQNCPNRYSCHPVLLPCISSHIPSLTESLLKVSDIGRVFCSLPIQFWYCVMRSEQWAESCKVTQVCLTVTCIIIQFINTITLSGCTLFITRSDHLYLLISEAGIANSRICEKAVVLPRAEVLVDTQRYTCGQKLNRVGFTNLGNISLVANFMPLWASFSGPELQC